MSVITLTTDFGDDEYAGIMKGVILSLNPSVIIVDVTHHISPQDLLQAAYSIYFSYRYFPQGTVHVVVVDPTVGSDRKIIALKSSSSTGSLNFSIRSRGYFPGIRRRFFSKKPSSMLWKSLKSSHSIFSFLPVRYSSYVPILLLICWSSSQLKAPLPRFCF